MLNIKTYNLVGIYYKYILFYWQVLLIFNYEGKSIHISDWFEKSTTTAANKGNFLWVAW